MSQVTRTGIYATLTGSVILWANNWGGTEEFTPVPGDYDGDGIADLALYHEDSGFWFIMSVQGNLITLGAYWGGEGFKPVPGDYDGDGKTDLAVYHEASGTWYIQTITGNIILWSGSFGGPGYKAISPVQ